MKRFILCAFVVFAGLSGCSSTPKKSRELTPGQKTIEAKIQEHADEFRVCHNRGKDQNATGEIRVVFDVNQAGRVTGTGIQKATLTDSTVQDCVLGVIENIRFPEQKTRSTQITYPLIFQ